MISHGKRIGDEDENDRIPAGFTYLGQLVAHDLVFHDLRNSQFTGSYQPMQLARTPRLDLDCIYGSGPAADPLLYKPEEYAFLPRKRFQLGRIEEGSSGNKLIDVFEDLPRFPCNKSTGSAPDRYCYETLIADPRNEDNLILSQLVVLFCKFHNIVVDELERIHWVEVTGADAVAGRKQFERAREITIQCYRRIIKYDFLNKLLDDAEYSTYKEYQESKEFEKFRCLKNLPESDADETANAHPVAVIPEEFWLGAFRVGHVMVRNKYWFRPRALSPNEGRPSDRRDPFQVGIDKFMHFSGFEGHFSVPISRFWVVDWSLFFRKENNRGSPGHEFFNNSRKISPSIAPGMVKSVLLRAEDDQDRGLQYRDLLRGGELKIKTGQEVAALYGSNRSNSSFIDNWLVDNNGEFLVDPSVRDHTPLFFYLLCEAAECPKPDGRHLGVLGSRIVADVMFGTLLASGGVCENDKSEYPEMKELFPEGIPKSMWDMIEFVERKTSAPS